MISEFSFLIYMDNTSFIKTKHKRFLKETLKVVLNNGDIKQLGSLNQEEKYFAYVIGLAT